MKIDAKAYKAAWDTYVEQSFDVALTTGDILRLALEAYEAAKPQPAAPDAFQSRVQPWMMACFGPVISGDKLERGDRLLEEVLELLQSGDYPKERAYALIEYVDGRPKGEPAQEAGGVMVTLAAYCLAHDLDMHAAGETELARIWTKVEQIRAKQAAKPTGSALPIAVQPAAPEVVAWPEYRYRNKKGGAWTQWLKMAAPVISGRYEIETRHAPPRAPQGDVAEAVDLDAIAEVIRISDRSHPAWDGAKTALATLRACAEQKAEAVDPLPAERARLAEEVRIIRHHALWLPAVGYVSDRERDQRLVDAVLARVRDTILAVDRMKAAAAKHAANEKEKT